MELNNELGMAKEDAGVIYANVRNVLADEEKVVESHFKELDAHCQSAEGGIAAAIVKLNNAINESTKSFNEWQQTAHVSAKDGDKARKDIAATTLKIKHNKKAVDKAGEHFRLTLAETDQKLAVVRVLRDIITDEILNARVHLNSFVQLTKFTEKLDELKAMLNSDTDSLYSPLVSVLLELASEENFSDQKILKKILENINNLEKSLKDFRESRRLTLEAEIKNLKANAANLNKIRNAYQNMSAQSKSKMVDAQHYMRFYTNEMAHFKAERGRKEAEKSLLKKLCDFEDNAHAQDKKDLDLFKKKVLPLVAEQVQELA